MKRERQAMKDSFLKMSLRIHKQDFVEGMTKIKTTKQELSDFKDEVMISVGLASEIMGKVNAKVKDKSSVDPKACFVPV